jgi:YegS/Rv2252/BmrU family lipid kinase
VQVNSECLLLVNPASGGGKALKIAPRIAEILQAANFEVRQHVTTSQLDLIEQIRIAGTARVYLLAGDGSLQAAARVIVNEQLAVELAPLPAGRGNDFCAVIGTKKDPLQAVAKTISNPELISVDVMLLNQSLVALGAISVGLDAAAARIAHEIQLAGKTWLRGAPLYVYSALKALSSWQTKAITVQLDAAAPLTKPIWLFVVSNSGRFGGGMKIAPHSNLQDGMLEIVSVGEVSKLDFLITLPKVFFGRHLNHPKLELATASRIKIDSKEPIMAFADGEPITQTPIEIEVLPGALKLLI